MRSFMKTITVMAAALMIFSLPVIAGEGTMGQYAERGSGTQVVDIGTINQGGGSNPCFPFVCD